MCYCSLPDDHILADIQSARIPDTALVNSCCWSRVCQVRGRNFSVVENDTWVEICTQRGYIHARKNPRGF